MLVLPACYSSMQCYFKIDLILQYYSIFNFYIKNHEPFKLLIKNLPIAGQE